jgi:hypothetical protein
MEKPNYECKNKDNELQNDTTNLKLPKQEVVKTGILKWTWSLKKKSQKDRQGARLHTIPHFSPQ